jgi:hypothetical protein
MTGDVADLVFVADVHRDMSNAISLNPLLDRDSRTMFLTILVLSDTLRVHRVQEGASAAVCENVDPILNRPAAEWQSATSESQSRCPVGRWHIGETNTALFR